MSPSGSVNNMTVTCLVCNGQFDQHSIRFMTSHRTYCEKEQPVPSTSPNADEQRVQTTDYGYFAGSMVAAETPAQTINANVPDESRYVDVAQNSPNSITATSYTIEPLSDVNRLRFSIRRTNTSNETEDGKCAECQMCKNIFVTDSTKVLRYW